MNETGITVLYDPIRKKTILNVVLDCEIPAKLAGAKQVVSVVLDKLASVNLEDSLRAIHACDKP